MLELHQFSYLYHDPSVAFEANVQIFEPARASKFMVQFH